MSDQPLKVGSKEFSIKLFSFTLEIYCNYLFGGILHVQSQKLINSNFRANRAKKGQCAPPLKIHFCRGT